MSRRGRGSEGGDDGVDEFVSAVGLRAAELPHPVDLITVVAAAERANVAPTTVDSAIRNAGSFRNRVLAAAVRTVDGDAGPQTWDALRSVVAQDGSPTTMVELFAARSAELADDPAVPFLISAFDRLEVDEVSAAASDALHRIVCGFWPFLATAAAALDVDVPPEPSERQEFTTALALLGDTYGRLQLMSPLDPVDSARLSRPWVHLVERAIVGDRSAVDRPVSAGWSNGQLVRAPSPGSPPLQIGLVHAAIDAAKELLLEYAVPIATSVSVAEAVTRAQSSRTQFYKLFGSVERFARTLVVNSGREIVSTLPEDLFSSTLAIARGEGLSFEEALAVLWEQYLPLRAAHVEGGRPGRELIPWLGSDVVQPVIAKAHQDACLNRAGFYDELVDTTGGRGSIGLRGDEIGHVLDAWGVVLELLVRNAPDRAAAVDLTDELFGSLVDGLRFPPPG